MSEGTGKPSDAEPLWRFSLAFYECPRIADAHADLALYLGSENAGSAEAAVIREALDAFVREERPYRSPRPGLARREGSPQRRTVPVSRPKRSRTRPKV